MRMAKRRNSRRAGFEKCPIPWKELNTTYNNNEQQDSMEWFKINSCLLMTMPFMFNQSMVMQSL